jgi:hypothetical protein
MWVETGGNGASALANHLKSYALGESNDLQNER